MNPPVSIITTFYNSVSLGDFVRKAMDSLLNQSYKNIEFICVNDGSKDDTLNQLLAYQKKDDRIQIINKKNEGTAQYAKAAGQDAATGEYIMLFDHDDAISSDAVEKAVQEFIKNPELDMVGMIVKTIFSDGKIKNIYALDELLQNIDEYRSHWIKGSDALQKTIGRYDIHFRGFYRKDLFKKVSFRFTERLLNADEIVERQLLQYAHKIGTCNGIYTHYIFLNSSAKSFNLKKIDIVATDLYMRDFAKKLHLYESRKAIFESVAYKNFIDAVKVHHYFKPILSAEQNEFYNNRLKSAYHGLDKKTVLETYRGFAKVYNQILLSNFSLLSQFYKIKK